MLLAVCSAMASLAKRVLLNRQKAAATSCAAILCSFLASNIGYGFSFTSQPQSQTVAAGSNATFAVSTGGAGGGTTYYQWWFNATAALSGATNDTLILTNVQAANAGSYRVVATNTLAGISITSQVATLTVFVSFPDTNLETAIRTQLSKPSGLILASDMLSLTQLDASHSSGPRIRNLSGLETALNLTNLNLSDNAITNSAPLAGLSQLLELHLDTAGFSNIVTLAGLTNLHILTMYNNYMQDLAPLTNLLMLQQLDVSWCDRITNPPAMAALTNLVELRAEGIHISSGSFLAGLKKLQFLDLYQNSVRDVSPLLNLTNLFTLGIGYDGVTNAALLGALSQLADVGLDGNSLSNIGFISTLTNLQGLTLNNNNISDISALSGIRGLTNLDLGLNSVTNVGPVSGLTNLITLTLFNNYITNAAPLAGLFKLQQLFLEDNNLQAIDPLLGLTNLALVSLTNNFLSTNVGSASFNLVAVLQGRGATVFFIPQKPLLPYLVVQPVSQTVANGSNVVLSVVAGGSGPFFFQWRLNGTNLPFLLTTVAGNGTNGFSGDGGPAINAMLNQPWGAGSDAAGNIYIADGANNRVRRVAPNGIITTIAGTGTPSYSGDSGPATNATLNAPENVSVDANGNVFIADTLNGRVRKITSDGTITTVAGNGSLSVLLPEDVQLDALGNLVIPEYTNHRVTRVATNGVMTTIAGNGAPGYSGDGGPAVNAQLNEPVAVALAANGNFYIADYANSVVRKVTTNGIITTAAGGGALSGDGVLATNANLGLIYGVAADGFDNLFISLGSGIRRVGPDGVIWSVSGTAVLSFPEHIALDSSGDLLVAEYGGPRIRKVTGLSAQTPNLLLSQLTNSGAYDVVIVNAFGSVTSAVANITVVLPVSITTQPQSQTVSAGTIATFSVGASGASPAYQWYFNGTNRISGATNAVASLTNVQPANMGGYSVVVTNPVSAITSQVATLCVQTTFTHLTNSAVEASTIGGYSISWIDYDNDGYLDLLFVCRNGGNFLLHNNGNGTFARITNNIVQESGQTDGGTWADVNNDGYMDLLLAKSAGSDVLFMNNGNGTFTRMPSSIPDGVADYAGAWGDYDNDGFVDLFLPVDFAGNNQLYHNNRDGTFTRVTSGPEVNDGVWNTTAVWGDFNNDGYLDLFVPNNGNSAPAVSALYRNDGGTNFTPVSAGDIGLTAGISQAAAWGDYDNDGFLDLFVANYSGPGFLFHNNGDGTFAKVLSGPIATDANNSPNCAWGDYDNDGFLDLFVAGVPFLYHNNGDGTFTRVTNSLTTAGPMSGGMWGDFDRDGFLDFAVCTYTGTGPGDVNQLYRNNGNSNAWLNVRCVGSASNRAGIGAKVRVKATIGGVSRWQMREVSGGSGWGLQNLECNFGLGDSTNVDLLRIEWPLGKVQQFTNIAPRQFLTIQEQTTFRLYASGSGSVSYSPVKSDYLIGDFVTLTATPGRYYTFVQWSDGNTNAIRSISVRLTNDFTAIFTNILPLEELVFKQWDKTYGGSDVDVCTTVRNTTDGGFILGGWSYSQASGNKSSTNYGLADYWLVKIDGDGNKQWERVFGGAGPDNLNTLEPTADGGFILGGESGSSASGNKTSGNFGSSDFWILKLDGNGNKQWETNYGGSSADALNSIQQTHDGGYIFAGSSQSAGGTGNKSAAGNGGYDFWLIKTDASGVKQWERDFGGGSEDIARAVRQTADGGFVLGGSYTTLDPDRQLWAIKTDSGGAMTWSNVLGGINGTAYTDTAYGAEPTWDGRYVLAGFSASPPGATKSAPNYGSNDFWLVKVDTNGNRLWDNTFGGSGDEVAYAFQQTTQGDFILGGYSTSGQSGNKTSSGFGDEDYWLVKTDMNGNKLWEAVFGGSGQDEIRSVQQTRDGYILAGSSDSGTDGNKTSLNYGARDYWVVRLVAREAPIGMPLLLVNGQYSPSNSFVFVGSNSVSVELRSSYTNGTIAYTLDGSDPTNALDDPGPIFFTVTNTVTIRSVALDSLGIPGLEADPVTITFIPAYTLMATSPGGGTVVASPPAGTYASNSLVTVTATANAGWTFLYWLGDTNGVSNLASNSIGIVISTNKFVQAIFGTAVNVGVVGSGTVLTNPILVLYPFGSTVRLSAVPTNSNAFFRFWQGDANGQVVSPLDFFITNANPNPVARFASLPANTHSLTVLINGNGTVTRNPQISNYVHNSSVTLTASNAPGWVFVNWTGDVPSTQNPLTVLMDTNKMNIANFSVTAASNTPPTVQITNPSTGAPFTNPAVVIIAASASDVDGTVSRVELYDAFTQIASLTNSPYSFSWSNISVAAHVLTAQAIDNLGARGTSSPVSITVQTALPQVVLSSPTNGNTFFTPVSIQVNAVASDADNSLARVELYTQPTTNSSQPILLSSITNPPYSFIWSGMVTGAYTLTARAVDSYGPIVTSAPVTITLSLPPTTNPPVFLFSQTNYQVNESNASVALTVLNPGDLGGQISYRTLDGTAYGGNGYSGDYTTTLGALLFAAGQHSTNISIPIRDNFLNREDIYFQVQLYQPSAGTLGNPAVAIVTIHENDVGGATNSLTTTAPGSGRPPTNGRLQVTLAPPEAGGQWRFPWEQGWRNSGDAATNLEAGDYPVEFRSLSNYLAFPRSLTATVTNNGATPLAFEYFPTLPPGSPGDTGLLTVNIGPNAPTNSGWKLFGEGAYRAPNSTASGLVPDAYFIEFAPVSGWSRPASRAVQVFGGQSVIITANYLSPAQLPPGAAIPAVVPTGQFVDSANFPYWYNGQLLTDAGYGSGVAVRETVVLTAAHLVFNDLTLSYVSHAWWWYQEEVGVFEPKPMSARGWYVLSGYAAARTNDLPPVGNLAPDVSSPQSRQQDAAALYFLSPAARGGYGGYLASDVVPNPWLSDGTRPKMLAGYPVDATAFGTNVQPGKLYSTPQLSSVFTQSSNDVYTANWFISFPGNSGGPVYVRFNNNYFYPAAIYLGTLGSGPTSVSAVRAITSDVVNLINLASSLGDAGTNHTGGGVITFIPIPGVSASNPADVQILLGPPAARQAGAGWRLHGDPTFGTAANYTREVTTNGASIEFKPITGWNPPADRTVPLTAGALTVISNINYSVVPPVMVFNPGIGLGMTGTTNTAYRLERATNLLAGNWVAIRTNTLSNGFNLLLPWPPTNGASSFYRATWLP